MNQGQALAAQENDIVFRQVPMFIAVGHRVGVAILEIMTGKRSPKEAMDACNADLVNIAKRGGGKINEADLIKN
jgi:ABC-type glycerol-3-phosphate transport system substrate-binding protein